MRLKVGPAQEALGAMLAKHAQKVSARTALKWCNRCGGKHRGSCNLVITSAGTRCRVEILEQVERRIRATRDKEKSR